MTEQNLASLRIPRFLQADLSQLHGPYEPLHYREIRSPASRELTLLRCQTQLCYSSGINAREGLAKKRQMVLQQEIFRSKQLLTPAILVSDNISRSHNSVAKVLHGPLQLFLLHQILLQVFLIM